MPVEYREGKICRIFKERVILPNRCDMPANAPCAACPIPVAQTGDRSFAQALAEYRQLVDPSPVKV